MRLHRLDISTVNVDHPAGLIEETRFVRRSMAEIIDNRSRTDQRWTGIRYYASWSPVFDAGKWSARMRGVVYTDLIGEIAYIDAFERMSISRTQAMITPFLSQSVVPLSLSSLRDDVYEWTIVSMSDVSGLDHCDDAGLSSICNEIHYASESKVLLARRGFGGTFA